MDNLPQADKIARCAQGFYIYFPSLDAKTVSPVSAALVPLGYYVTFEPAGNRVLVTTNDIALATTLHYYFRPVFPFTAGWYFQGNPDDQHKSKLTLQFYGAPTDDALAKLTAAIKAQLPSAMVTQEAGKGGLPAIAIAGADALILRMNAEWRGTVLNNLRIAID